MTVAVSANLLVGRSAHAARPGIRNHLSQDAPVVAFQEAGGYLGTIRELAASRGYRVIAAPATAGRGMNSSVLCVQRDRTIATGVALVRAPWVGPRLKIKWPGRGIPWAVVNIDGKRTLVASIHGPTGRSNGNSFAWRRYLRRLRRMSRRLSQRYDCTHVLFLGDWNCPASATDRTSVRRLLADRIGARIVKTGTPIDYAVTDLELVGTEGDDFGSDHPSVHFYWKAAR